MHPQLFFKTITFRLTLIYSALFSLSVILLLGFIYFTTTGIMLGQVEKSIQSSIADIKSAHKKRGVRGVQTLINDMITHDDEGLQIYLLADESFEPLAGNLDQWPNKITDDLWVEFTLNSTRHPETGLPVRAIHIELPGNHHLLVGTILERETRFQRMIMETLGAGLGLTVILAVVSGTIMTRMVARRIETINRTSNYIMQGHLSERIKLEGSGDVFDQLYRNLNTMLDTISHLMESVRQVSDDIAHDLKTPLTRLRTRVEDALRQKNLNEAEARILLQKTLESLDGLIHTFNAILRISRLEVGEGVENFAPILLQDLAHNVIDLYAPLSEEKQQNFHSVLPETEVYVLGDRHLLSQALANLLDNAIKYTPAGGNVSVEATLTGRFVHLSVMDSGGGIPDEFKKKVLERFYRMEKSRKTPGNGLGLSLVAAVARLHGHEVILEDAPSHAGLRVTLILPLDTTSA